MEESIKQKQVASLIDQEINEVFRKLNLFTVQKGMVSISYIRITPDLLEAKIYLSFFQVEDKENFFKELQNKYGEIRKELGNRVRNKLRRVPVLVFFEDTSVETGFRIEELLKTIDIPKEKEE